MTKKTVYRIGVFNYDDKNVIYIPNYDFSEWTKDMIHVLSHNKYSPQVRKSTISQMKEAFFSISEKYLSCPSTEKKKCQEKFPQDDFLYITCRNKKKLTPFHIQEIILIILLFSLLIKINYNVFTNK